MREWHEQEESSRLPYGTIIVLERWFAGHANGGKEHVVFNYFILEWAIIVWRRAGV